MSSKYKVTALFVFFLLFFKGTSFAFAFRDSSGRPGRPNIIIILMDDMGYVDPEFNNGIGYTTPHMDELAARGPVDICILGLGLNGHIALNEPADALEPGPHVAKLSSKSIQHSMLSGVRKKPAFGLTLGIADILQSKMVLMLISGNEKKEITRLFLTGKVSTRLPASFLWIHPNVICLISRDAI